MRELDRYHGFAAAGRPLPERRRPRAPAEGAMAFGAALVCSARFTPQVYEEIAFTPVIAIAPEAARPLEPDAFSVNPGRHCEERSDEAIQRPQDALWSPERDLAFAAPSESGPSQPALHAPLDDRPRNLSQSPEKIDSAPGTAGAPEAGHENIAQGQGRASERPGANEDVSALDARLTDRPQFPRGGIITCDDVGQPPPLDTPLWPYKRPENSPQSLDTLKSAPGNLCPGEASRAQGEAAFDTPMVLTPAGWRRSTMRMTLNGVAAS